MGRFSVWSWFDDLTLGRGNFHLLTGVTVEAVQEAIEGKRWQAMGEKLMQARRDNRSARLEMIAALEDCLSTEGGAA